MIAVLTAMDKEIEGTIAMMTQRTVEKIPGMTVHLGELGGRECLTAVTGMGKVMAAAGTERIIGGYAPEVVLFTGIAGSIDQKMQVGDLFIARDMMEWDVDVRPFTRTRGELPFGATTLRCSDPALIAAAESMPVDSAVTTGRLLTGDTFVSELSPELVKELTETLEGAAVDMEGAAFAAAAAAHGIPFLCIRVISDTGNGIMPGNMNGFLKESSARLARIVLHIAETV